MDLEALHEPIGAAFRSHEDERKLPVALQFVNERLDAVLV